MMDAEEHESIQYLRSLPRQPFPEGRYPNGRPVWEPPILDYSKLIDDEYENKREAVLKLTKFITHQEQQGSWMRPLNGTCWACAIWIGGIAVESTDDPDVITFFARLMGEVVMDYIEISEYENRISPQEGG